MSEQQQTAFVDWVNTFNNLSNPVNKFKDLTDGRALFEILHEIEPLWFKIDQQSDVRDDNWVVKSRRLQKLHKLLIRHYEEKLGHSTKGLDQPDLTAIAKEDDLMATMTLCSLIVTWAVCHENKAIYIEKIQKLSPLSQGGLMNLITVVMGKLEGTSSVEPATVEASENMSYDSSNYIKERNKLVSDKEALERSLQALIAEHTQLRDQFDDLQAERDELKQRLKDIEISLAQSQSSHSGKADFRMKTEIENLRQEINTSEVRRHEAEMLIESQNGVIAELTRKVEELHFKEEEAARLKDQLDESRHNSEKLKKAENAIEKYKKKMEEGADLRRMFKTLEEENRELAEQNAQITEEFAKVNKLKAQLEPYKNKVEELEQKNKELVSLRNKYEYEYKNMRAKIEAYEMEKSRDIERIQLLEDRLRELEFGGGERLNLDEKEEEVDDIDAPVMGGELANALTGTTMTQLRLRNNELERELRSWRNKGKSADDDQEIIVLQRQLADAVRSKERSEKDYQKVQTEKLDLESKLARVMSGAGLDINDSNKELHNTKKQLFEVESKLRNAEKQLAEYKANSAIDERVKDIEAEKEMYKAKYEELDSLLKSFGHSTEDELKAEIVKCKLQNATNIEKIKRLKNIMAGQDEAMKNHMAIEESFKVEKESYEDRFRKQKREFEEAKTQLTLENRLMVSAWFGIGRLIQRDNVSLQRGTAPKAFLGQQRQAASGQMKRR